jgi:hypothetical protein
VRVFENRAPKGKFGPEKKWQEAEEEDSIMRSLIFAFHKIF